VTNQKRHKIMTDYAGNIANIVISLILGVGFLLMAFRFALYTPEELMFPLNILLTGLFFAGGLTMLTPPVIILYRYIKSRKKESINDTTES
jgi:hypothetical protein